MCDESTLNGGLLLTLRRRMPHFEPLQRNTDELLEEAGAGRSQAYEMSNRIDEVLPTLYGRPGRPPATPVDPDRIARVSQAVAGYLFRHPGAADGAGIRNTYTDGYRRFVVDLVAPGQPGEELSVAQLAPLVYVPRGTLKDWLRCPRASAEQPLTSPSKPAPSEDSSAGTGTHEGTGTSVPAPVEPVEEDDDLARQSGETASSAETSELLSPGAEESTPDALDRLLLNSHLRLIVALWANWRGHFKTFCRMLRTEHRVPYKDTWIGNFLQCAGLRQRRRRMPVEAPWSPDTFRRLFPGAQWLGDGTSIAVHWEDHVFVFNVEAILDVASNAVLGFKVTDSEDEKALLEAVQAGIETAGNAPLGVTLDNRPSNHSEEVVSALEAEGMTVLAATPGRGQAKAPLEGAFGLFQQSLPALVLTGHTARELARCALMLILLAWFRGRNGRPRERFNGLGPALFYNLASPTPEQIEAARKWIAELQRRQERTRRTREARRDPVRIQVLIRGLAELGIPDESNKLAIALACYSRDAIIRGLSTFATKKEKGTLPADADPGRYLGGIIRQLDTRLELQRLSEYLLVQRIRARDISLAPLVEAAGKLRAELCPEDLPQAFVDRALHATFMIDFQFWARAATEAFTALSQTTGPALYRSLSRRIAASFKTDRQRREDLIDRFSQATALAAA